MASTPPHVLAQTKKETPYSTPKLRPATRRTPSFSSSSRSNSSDSSSDSSPFLFNDIAISSPIASLKLMGIPFSWEQTPGIPKHGSKKTETSGRRLLPLPPAGTTATTTKKWRSSQEEISPKKHLTRFKRDPFFAAMIECSKDDDHDHDHDASIWKGSLSDRFGFINIYTSCKKTCAVSESIVHVPRASPHYLLHNHRHRST